jgi:predicted transcriptional regulator
MRPTIVADRTSPVTSMTTQVPRALYNAVDEIAERRGMTKSELLRKLITEFVAKEST